VKEKNLDDGMHYHVLWRTLLPAATSFSKSQPTLYQPLRSTLLPTMFIKTLFSFLLLVVAFCAAQRDAMEDIQLGMQGLKEAVKDPALLAQLIRDMQV
jgi:hypothetical protein